jgi:hypothetical protein
MATTALVAPTVTIPDPQFLTGVGLTATTGTAVGTGAQTVTVPYVANLVVAIISLTTAPGLLTLVSPGFVNQPASLTFTPGAAGVYLFALGQEWVSPTTGLVTLTIGTAVATTFASAYVLTTLGTGAKHSPFEVNPQLADF